MIEIRYNADGKLEYRIIKLGVSPVEWHEWIVVPSVEKEIVAPKDNNLRTERITLEITHDCATNLRDWHCWKRENFPLNPHESLRVVEESETSDRCHRWDRDGERCLKCNDKDWMGGPCNTTDEEYIARMAAERDAARAESDRLRAAGDAMAEALTWDQSCAYDAATTRGAIRQRIAAWSEARACVAELEGAAAPVANAGGEDAVVVPQTVVAGNFAQIHWNTCCRLHRMAMDKAGVRWTQSTEPSRPEIEEAGNAGGEQVPVAWGVLSAGEITQVSLLQWRGSLVRHSQRLGGTIIPLYAAPVTESATTPQPRSFIARNK